MMPTTGSRRRLVSSEAAIGSYVSFSDLCLCLVVVLFMLLSPPVPDTAVIDWEKDQRSDNAVQEGEALYLKLHTDGRITDWQDAQDTDTLSVDAIAEKLNAQGVSNLVFVGAGQTPIRVYLETLEALASLNVTIKFAEVES